jgi:hypothetical protein
MFVEGDMLVEINFVYQGHIILAGPDLIFICVFQQTCRPAGARNKGKYVCKELS